MFLNRKRLAYSCAIICASHLQSKLVEEIVEEVLNAAQHAVIQVAPGDVMKEGSSGRWDLVVAETVELLVSVNSHLEG